MRKTIHLFVITIIILPKHFALIFLSLFLLAISLQSFHEVYYVCAF